MATTGWKLAGMTLLAMLLAPKADAVEPLSTEELISHCVYYEDDPDGEDGIFCVRYVQGFIDGAMATDERVAQNVAEEIEQDESFSERAIRTRVGSRLKRFGPSVYAEFCLGEPVPLKEVVDVVVKDLLNNDFIRDKPLAREAVYATLRRVYACETD